MLIHQAYGKMLLVDRECMLLSDVSDTILKEVPRSDNKVSKRPYTIKIRHVNEVIRAVLTRAVMRPKFYQIRQCYDMFATWIR